VNPDKTLRDNPDMGGVKDVGFYDRIVTYEGLEQMSVEEKVFSNYVIKDVTEAINSIIDHLCQQDVYLTKAVFYFRYDRSEDLYLLFATNLN
jgi:hypothetical protein